MKWIDSHRRVDKSVTVGDCRINRLLFADELVLHAWIFSTGSSARILSVLCCVRPSRNKNSTKNIEVLYLLRCPRQLFLQVSGNRLQQVEISKYLGVVFTSDESQNKGIDARIGKENAVLRELYLSVVTKREHSKKPKLQFLKKALFLNRSLFRSSPAVMNLR